MPYLLSDEEVITHFGHPASHMRPDGTITAAWENLILDSFDLMFPLPLDWLPTTKVTRIRCHFKILPLLKKAIDEIQMDPETRPLLVDFGGCYEWRRQRGAARKLSRHAWGIAVDIDPSGNPMGRKPTIDPRVVAAFERNGFYWGGNFKGSRRDGMHFEFGDPSRLAA